MHLFRVAHIFYYNLQYVHKGRPKNKIICDTIHQVDQLQFTGIDNKAVRLAHYRFLH